MTRRMLSSALPALSAMVLIARVANAASTPPPADFAGVALGTSLRELKDRYPEVKRNPDSDRQFQVYQVPALKGSSVKTPGAFNIYKGRVVGGQILLDQNSARFWYDAMVTRYGKPDDCTYCEDPELVSATWNWGNGTRLKVAGEMITLLTEEGAAQRQKWLARGDSEDSGDEASDLGESTKQVVSRRVVRRRSGEGAPAAVPISKPTGWRGLYEDEKYRIRRYFGWSK